MHRCLLRGYNLSTKGSTVSSLFTISPSRTGDGGAAPADSSQLINRWPTQTKAAESPRPDERPRLIRWQLDDSWSVTGNLSYTRAWPWMKVMWLLDQSEATMTSEWREERLCFCPGWERFYFIRSDLFYLLFMFEVCVVEAISVQNYCIFKSYFSFISLEKNIFGKSRHLQLQLVYVQFMQKQNESEIIKDVSCRDETKEKNASF